MRDYRDLHKYDRPGYTLQVWNDCKTSGYRRSMLTIGWLWYFVYLGAESAKHGNVNDAQGNLLLDW